MNIPALKEALNNHDIGTVVATMGTTLGGSVDPLPEILSLRAEGKFRVHADAAYGGYYVLATESLNKQTALSFAQLSEVDSLVIDPHKHGLLPYGCGCVLFKDVSVAAFYKHQSPYTYLCSPEMHLGEISLECSRPGAAAVALWAMQRFFPLVKDGDFARGLSKSRRAAQILMQRLSEDKKFLPLLEPDLDIVLWTVRNPKASLCSSLNEELRQRAAAQNLYLVVAKVPTRTVAEIAQQNGLQLESDADEITCLRSCLMKPDHLDWLDEIWQILNQTTADILVDRMALAKTHPLN
jgi:glutamate/tyrosine decarboxylase-like PLP-dependent enzyme